MLQKLLCAAVVFALLHKVEAEENDGVMSAADFQSEVPQGDRVWVIVFGVTSENTEYQTAKALQKQVPWLEVRWINVASSFESRVIAEVHGVASFPAIRVFNGHSAIRISKAELTPASAIEKWLPTKLPTPGVLSEKRAFSHILPRKDIWNEDEMGAPRKRESPDCVFKLSSDLLSEAPVIAALRAVSMRVWRMAGLAYETSSPDTVSLHCSDIDVANVILSDEVDAASALQRLVEEVSTTFALKVIASVAPYTTPVSEMVASARVRAAERKLEAAVPALSRISDWNYFMKEPVIGAFFIVDSRSDRYNDDLKVAASVAKLGGGKASKQVPFEFRTIDAAREPRDVRRVLQNAGKPPTLSFVLPVQGKDPRTGELQLVRAVHAYSGELTTEAIQAFIEDKLVKDPSILQQLDLDLAPEELSGDTTGNEADSPEPSVEPLSLVKDPMQSTKKKAAKATKKAKSKKTISAKEKERQEKVKNEIEAKKAAREKRLREKQEKEAAEKATKKKQKEEAKASKKKKKSPADKKGGSDKTSQKGAGKPKDKATGKTKNEKVPKKQQKESAENKDKTDAKAEKKKGGPKKKDSDKKGAEKSEAENEEKTGAKQFDEESIRKLLNDEARKKKATEKLFRETIDKEQEKQRREERKEAAKRRTAADQEKIKLQQAMEKEWTDEDGDDISIRDEL